MEKLEKIEKLKKLMEIVNSDAPSKKEISQFFQALSKSIREFRADMGKMAKQSHENVDDKANKYFVKAQKDLNLIKKNMKEMCFDEMRVGHKKIKAEMIGIIEEMTHEMMEEMVEIRAMHESMEIPEPDMAEDIRNKLELLQGKERLNKSAIEGIESIEEDIKRLDEKIASITSQNSGGGVTNLRIQQAFKYILKTEEPTGDIDGVNTVYTVSQPIFAVLAFSLNGEVVAQLPNYTISGNKITFSSALPAVYSGKDFECKYI